MYDSTPKRTFQIFQATRYMTKNASTPMYLQAPLLDVEEDLSRKGSLESGRANTIEHTVPFLQFNAEYRRPFQFDLGFKPFFLQDKEDSGVAGPFLLISYSYSKVGKRVSQTKTER